MASWEEYGSFSNNPNEGSFGYGMDTGFNTRDLFRSWAINTGIVETNNQENWDAFFDDYGSFIDEFSYDYTKDILDIKGMGSSFDALRSTEENKLVGLTDRLGAFGMKGGGYQYKEGTKSIYENWEEQIDSSREALRVGIAQRKDDWMTTEFYEGITEQLGAQGVFGSDDWGGLFNAPLEDPAPGCLNVNGESVPCNSSEAYYDSDGNVIGSGGGNFNPNCEAVGMLPDPDGGCYEPIITDPTEIEWSDVKLKKNIVKVGNSKSGLNIYEFDYINKKYGKGRYRGVMAQEVPNASFLSDNGYYMVDYSKIDVKFERIA